ncbi:hypothetical protein Vi05172_g3873 [Venturia inaequalis]|nr:hypothetical protein Vi05172_g3873 [Venturia inaequalis]
MRLRGKGPPGGTQTIMKLLRWLLLFFFLIGGPRAIKPIQKPSICGSLFIKDDQKVSGTFDHRNFMFSQSCMLFLD